MTVRHDPVDIVTVGAGWTAAMLGARILPSSGLRMVSLEQGPARWTYPHFAHNHDGLRYSARYAMMVDLDRETWTWRPNPSAPSLPMRQYGAFLPGRGVGGAAVHWSAQLWRFLETDFRYRSHHVERYGEAKLPEGAQVQDWPVTYGELEPYYRAFEEDIGASGATGNLRGAIQDQGNPFEAPRSTPFPNPPLQVGAFAELFGRAARSRGLHPFPQPAAILSRAWTDPWGRTRSACIYCGFCTHYGCEVDAKASPVNVHFPVSLETGRHEVRAGCKVLRIETARDGRATGVTYVDGQGEDHFQPAEVVALTAFTLENVRLLLLSRSDAHPDGIGNDRGRVGRNFTYQLYLAPVKGLFEGRRFGMFMGNTCTINILYDFNGDVFDHSDVDFIGGAQIYSSPCERDPVTSAADLGEGFLDRQWGARWKELMRRSWDGIATVNIEGESLPYRDQFLDLDPTYTDRWGRPLLRLTFDWHENDRRVYRFMAQRCTEVLRAMGPSRMAVTEEVPAFNIHDYKSTHPAGGAITGDDPSRSVVNSFGQVWDTPNVFVTGAAMFPQNPGANPTGTIGAMTYRAADALRDRYFDAPMELLG